MKHWVKTERVLHPPVMPVTRYHVHTGDYISGVCGRGGMASSQQNYIVLLQQKRCTQNESAQTVASTLKQ